MMKKQTLRSILISCGALLLTVVPIAAFQNTHSVIFTENQSVIELSDLDTEDHQVRFKLHLSGNGFGGVSDCKESYTDGIRDEDPSQTDPTCNAVEQNFLFNNAIIPPDAKIIKTLIVFDVPMIDLDRRELGYEASDNTALWYGPMAKTLGVAFYGENGAELVSADDEHGANNLFTTIFTKNKFTRTLNRVEASFKRMSFDIQEEYDYISLDYSGYPLLSGAEFAKDNYTSIFMDGKQGMGSGVWLEETDVPENAVGAAQVQFIYNDDLFGGFPRNYAFPIKLTVGLNYGNPTVLIYYRDADGYAGVWQSPAIQNSIRFVFNATL